MVFSGKLGNLFTAASFGHSSHVLQSEWLRQSCPRAWQASPSPHALSLQGPTTVTTVETHQTRSRGHHSPSYSCRTYCLLFGLLLPPLLPSLPPTLGHLQASAEARQRKPWDWNWKRTRSWTLRAKSVKARHLAPKWRSSQQTLSPQCSKSLEGFWTNWKIICFWRNSSSNMLNVCAPVYKQYKRFSIPKLLFIKTNRPTMAQSKKGINFTDSFHSITFERVKGP